MALLSLDDRRAAFRRARAARPFWGLGCLGPVVAAWPAAFAALSVGQAVRLYRWGGARAVLTAALDLPRGPNDGPPLPCDPVLWTAADPARPGGPPLELCGLALPAAVLARTTDGLAQIAAPVVASWDIAGFAESPLAGPPRGPGAAP